MKLTGYETYCLYLAIKRHFTSSYDYFKYNGKLKTSMSSFESRRDRFQFERLSKRYSSEEMRDFFVANFIKDNKWVGDLLTEDAHSTFQAYVKRRQSFSYVFETELTRIFQLVENPRDVFDSKNGYSILITEYSAGNIGIDTLSVIEHFFAFSKKFNKDYGDDDIIWAPIHQLIYKIYPFISFDSIKFKQIIKQTIEGVQ